MKAIATAPDQPTNYVALTTEESTARSIEEASAIAAKPMEDWLQDMIDSDKLMPRVVEDIIDMAGTTGLAPTALTNYNDKKSLRAAKPV